MTEVLTDKTSSFWILVQFLLTQGPTVYLVFIAAFLSIWMLIQKDPCTVPGPPSVPVFGTISVISRLRSKQRHLGILQLRKRFGDTVKLWIGRDRFVILFGFENIYKAFVEKKDVFSDRPINFLPVSRATRMGKGIVWNSGIQWKTLRRFTLQSLRDFGMGKCKLEAKILEEANYVARMFQNTSGRSFDPSRMFASATCNVIHNVIFGKRLGFDDPEFQNLVENFNHIFGGNGMVNPYSVFPWLKFFRKSKQQECKEAAFEDIITYIVKNIERHRESYSETYVRDFVDLYLKHGSTDGDIFAEGNIFRVIMDLFFAGTETTATSLSWLFLYMIQYPEIQERCRDEIESVIGLDVPVAYEDKSKLKFVEATILESQRLSNVAFTSLPHCANQDTEFGGHFIPKGTLVLAHLGSVHLDDVYFKDAHKFDPERFLDMKGNLIRPKNLIPFSIGPRICPGESLANMELFVIFTTIIQKFRISKKAAGDQLDLSGRQHMTVRPRPYEMRVEPIPTTTNN